MDIDPADLNQKELRGLFVGAIVPRPIAFVPPWARMTFLILLPLFFSL
jgi:hypothetical protein